MLQDPKVQFEKISKDYWVSKLANFKPEQEAFDSLVSEPLDITGYATSGELIDFYKITNGNSASEFVVFLSVYTILLKKYFGYSQNLIRSFPVLNKANDKDTHALFFYKTQFNESDSFKQLIAATKADVQECLKYGPVERSTLEESTVIVDANIRSALSLGISYNSFHGDANLSDNKSVFKVLITKQSDEGLKVEVCYDGKLFKQELVSSFLHSFIFLLHSLKSYLSVELSSIEILSQADKIEIIEAFNKTAKDYPHNKTVIDLFDEQVTKTPEAIAVVSDKARLSYKQLSNRVNKLANYLKNDLQVQRGDFVGILLERSEELVISILAILKVGATYIPIDINYPVERITFMLEDSGMKVLLTEACVAGDFSLFSGQTVVLEQAEINITSQQDSFSFRLAEINDLVYAIYTSGSTGKPKGVLVKHQGFTNLLNWYSNAIEASSYTNILLIAPVSFDLAQKNIFVALITGGKLCLSEKLHGDYAAIGDFIKAEEIHVLNAAPSAFYPLLQEYTGDAFNALASLSNVVLGGEPISLKHFLPWLNSGFCQANLINSYGPTECTDVVSYYKLPNTQWVTTSTIPIGKPIDNLWIYILDDSLSVVPIGVPGEVYISGVGISSGYLNNAALTDERFISNPFVAGTKMYKTGDLGYWLSDGNIEYIGRTDDQVKIRGFRIELGEIENLLLHHEKIKKAAVIAKENRWGEKQLIGYLVSDEMPDVSALRTYLSRSIPDYMIPDAFTQLAELPLTPSGKLDRKALALQKSDFLPVDLHYRAPGNELEKQLVSIWESVLDRTEISIDANFFHLGGHSLKVMQLASLINKKLKVDLSIKDLFEHVTIADQAMLIGSTTAVSYDRISAVGVCENYSLSNVQQRFWVLSQFTNSSLAYNMVGGLMLEGALSIDILERAILYMISRHEVLRTVFKENESQELRQFVFSNLSNFNITREDYTSFPDQESILSTVSKEEQGYAFDLRNGPLLRCRILKLSDEKNILFFTLHHIISDGWSMEVLSKEIVSVYNALKNGQPPALEALRIQYKDYAVWQNELLESGKLEEHQSYWLKQFDGDLPVIDLPLSNKRPLVKTYRGSSINKRLRSSLTEKLKKLCSKEECTLFMGLTAGLNALLYRYAGQNDIVIGSPEAGRSQHELEAQIGLYLNTLALRTKFEGSNNFLQLLQHTKAVLLDAYAHQLYPFDMLIDALDLKRDTSRSALFDIMLVFQSQSQLYQAEGLNNFEGLKASRLRTLQKQTSQFDLIFEFVEQDNQLNLNLNYNTDLYSDESAYQLCSHYEQLLEAMLDHLNTSIKDVDYLSTEELAQLQSFNETQTEYPAFLTIAKLFEQQVQLSPDATALVFGKVKLSYAELNERSNQLAHYLRDKHAVSSNDLIGIRLEKNEELIVAILATLKSGCAYLPLDISYPQERVDYMVKDSGCQIIITDSELRTYHSIAHQYKRDNLDVINTSSDLAYVMYTSGSTGKPKGVMVEQRGVIRLVKNTNYITITPRDRFLQTGSISFDAATFEIWGALLNGASLFLLSSPDFLNVNRLKDVISSQEISILWSTSSWFNELVEADISLFSGLKYLLVGGDRLSPYHINQVLDLYPEVTLINGYGPTENTTFSTCFILDNQYAHNIPIGKPISNSRAYIVGEGFKRQPIMVWGEIGLSGDGLAKGYINNQALTAEKFVNNPFEKGSSLYLTGDIGRWLADGTIEYLGRKDKQIKIRGFRVELGEIENTLLRYEGIHDALVVVNDGGNEAKTLTAFLVVQNLDTGAVRNYLSQQLPDYMVPAQFVRLDAIPLTSNGKVDYNALVFPDTIDGHVYTAPRNTIESVLVEIWQEVLGRDKISVNDHFFSIGGHSLKAVRLSSQVRKRLQAELLIEHIFRLTTIAQQAEYIAKADKIDYVLIPRLSTQPNYQLSHAQKRFWVLSQFAESSLAYNMAVVLMFDGVLNTAALEKAILYIVNRHESLRTIFKESAEEEVRQYILSMEDYTLAYSYADISFVNDTEAELNRLYREEQLLPFNLSEGPLLRIKLVKVTDNLHAFYYTMHHIISDGWSSQVLAKELVTVYNAFKNGEEPIMPPLAIQYKDYAAWHNAQLLDKDLEVLEAYWLQQFSGELPVLNLPGRSRPAIKTHRGNNLTRTISKELVASLRAVCEGEGATLFMGLLAGLNSILYRYTGQEDIIIGSPVAGRQHTELENQIGIYLDTLAFRARFSGENNFIELLRHVKDVSLDAYKYQGYPFDQLIDKLAIERDTSRSALFDVLLILQSQNTMGLYDRTSGLDDLTIRKLENTERSTSQFDLTFDFSEEADGLELAVTYNTDIYDREMIVQLCVHFESLLNQAILNTGKEIRSLDYLSAGEKNILLFDFNQTDYDYSQDTIIELFEAQALKNPHHIALVYHDIQLTYAELNARSNQLGHYLKDTYSIHPDDLIGIITDRSDWAIIGLLGILKSGAAYVPVDPELPIERNNYIIQDSRLRLLLTTGNVLYADVNTLVLQPELFKDQSTEQVLSSYNSDSLAYIIYTSGTTNVPKGVMVEHKNLTNYSCWAVRELNLSITSSSVLTSSLAFDLGYTSVFPVLIAGGTLHLVSKSIVLSPEELIHYIGMNKISYLKLTPSLFSVLVHNDLFTDSSLKHLDTVVMGGEMINSSDLVLAKQKCKGLKFVNHYGPTETTIGTIAHLVDHADFESFVSKPLIGRPIDNNKIYILDSNNELLPIGVAGELCIAGKGVSRGYLNQPELTQAKFIKNPHTGMRLYRSGDWGRWSVDGEIEIIGRRDDQLKIRGYRVETGEIEHRLKEHDSISEAIVLASSDKSGSQYLIGYLAGKKEIDVKEVRSHLERFLPEYMIPSYLIVVDHMPLTSNGKIDRKALLSNYSIDFSLAGSYIAARNEIEFKLVGIWEAILEKDKIGVSDNFFQLGGHSIKVIKLTSRIRKEFQIEIGIEVLFRLTTVAAQATYIAQTVQGEYTLIPKAEENVSYELSHAQQRLWILSQFEESSLAYHISRSILLTGVLDQRVLEKTMAFLISRHESLRTVFHQQEDGSVRQLVISETAVYFKISNEDLSLNENKELRLSHLSKTEQTVRFDLSNGPLLRCKLVKLEENKHVLLFTMHHIISDGSSMEVLSKEFISLYNSLMLNRPISLPALRIQYKDYAKWQNSKFNTKEFLLSESYWLNKFQGELPVLNLPIDHVRPLEKTHKGASVHFVLNDVLADRLKHFCLQEGGTLFMGLITGLNTLFYRYTEQDDIILGSPVMGRDHQDLESQIGLYLNTLALRTTFNREDSFKELFHNTKEVLVGAYSHQDYPFDQLIEKLRIDRDLSRSALFDVMVILQNQRTQFAGEDYEDLNGLLMSPLQNTHHNASQFDLTFEFVDSSKGLVLNLNYNTDIYSVETIHRMCLHYSQLLESALDHSEQKICSINYIDENETNSILNNFNDTRVDYSSQHSVIELFEKQVQLTPSAFSIRSNNIRLTYSELNKLTNQLSHHLIQDKQLHPGDYVAVKLERNEWMLITLLAILKAGCVYVPIDTQTPDQRVAYIVGNSLSKLLLEEKDIQSFKSQASNYPDQNTSITKGANSLFAVLYTTGSTGVPKGIKLLEFNVLNRLFWMWESYPFEANEVCSIKTSIGFVDHIWEIFGPLLKGVESVMFDKEALLNIEMFIEQLSACKVSRLVLVPSLLKEILSYKEACKKLSHLKYWTCSGETLSVSLVKDFYKTFNSHKLFNIYGSTEVTADATFYDTSITNNRNKIADPDLFQLKLDYDIKELLEDYTLDKIIKGNENYSARVENFSDVSLTDRTSPSEYIELLKNVVLPEVVNVSSSKFIGHMTGPVPPLIKELNELITSLNQNLVKEETSGVGILVERQVLGIFHHLVYKESESFYQKHALNAEFCLGVITGGGTLSNITALGFALSKALAPKGDFKGIGEEGLTHALRFYGYSNVKVIGSRLCHYSISKALKILGLGKNAFEVYDLDKQNLVQSKERLMSKIEELRSSGSLVLSLIGVAGSTEQGSVDDLAALGDIANHFGIHYHVDAAFGGTYLFSEKLAHKLKGIDKADSVAVCGHKQLYLPIGLSICVFKDPTLAKFSENNTYYQARKGSSDLGKYTIEGSRSFMSLILHGAMHIIGAKGYAEITEQNFDRAGVFCELVEADPAFELLAKPDLNIVLYRYLPQNKEHTDGQSSRMYINEINRNIQKQQFERGQSFVSYTELMDGNGHHTLWFRTVFMNPYTTTTDLIEILDEQKQLGNAIENNKVFKAKQSISSLSVPIGKPIGNVNVYILDSANGLCPIGVYGEICVGGNGLSDGYLNNEDLTREKFISNPFKTGGRLYKTGDIGRWMTDGNIEYSGRVDYQVKIRGFRIELGEIETVLLSFDKVKEAVVVAHTQDDDSKYLVAYIVSDHDDLNQLRGYLLDKLPDYMIPSYFVRLQQLPLMPNGKVDRRSLPKPEEHLLIGNNEYVAPRNDIEEKIVKIWQEVLVKDRISVTASFFEIGGNSLKVFSVLSRIKDQFGLTIDLKNYYRNPTIESLSIEIKASQWIKDSKNTNENIEGNTTLIF